MYFCSKFQVDCRGQFQVDCRAPWPTEKVERVPDKSLIVATIAAMFPSYMFSDDSEA